MHFIVIFQLFSGQARGGPNCIFWVIFGDFRGGGDFVFCKGKPGSLAITIRTSCVTPHTFSGKKKQHKHKRFSPNFPRTFLTLTPGCPGVKKFLPTTGATGKRTFRCGRPRFSAWTSMTRRVVKKLCTKKVCVDFLAPNFIFFRN